MKVDDYIKKYKRKISFFGAVMIVLSVYGVFYIEAANADYIETDDEAGNGGGPSSNIAYSNGTTQGSFLSEGENETHTPDTGNWVFYARFTLTWTDEADEELSENEGDTFRLDVTDPDGWTQTESAKNDHGEEGRIELVFEYGENDDVYEAWEVTVTLEEVGHQWLLGLGIIGTTDDGNDYTLDIEWKTYLE